jgi:hypothetical protein
MGGMKYIKFEKKDGKLEIVTFPSSINHDTFAESMRRIRDKVRGDWRRETRIPISAGFVSSDLTCYGRSESLRLESDPSDTDLLKSQFTYC